ncbi:TldD/PmbA family protein [Pararhodobacter zhoushanensis]|uniref:Metallopeptidase TldD-related protein n=1 Tax=Pararhodobacter zhoushanensis TaxID=2479545 RepID=A0ABT3GTU1_9RHOB|nr:metallopeptidase TldD-related protein [Pararhodobacter zhoushanensis]MCW1930951.1 metallopeptidase TldD-related protein [Pararhodobacter zhoushanensis]
MSADLAQALLAAARKAGADSADALVIEGTAVSIDVREGRLEHAERAEGLDIGLRVLIGKRQACVSSSDAKPETLATMAERAVAMAREAPEDPHAGLADPDQLSARRDAEGFELHDPAPEPDPAALEDDARRAEAAARAMPGISQIDQSSASYSHRTIHLAASNGFAGGYERSSRHTACVAITGTGTAMERDWASEGRVFQADLPSPESIGQLAGARTAARAGSRKPPSGAFPVLYDERVAASLIGHLTSAINGSAIARGASWLRDSMGKPVLPAGFDLTENPHRPRIGGTRVFDAEGLPTQRRVWVQDGVLQGWVLDLATARKLGMQSTGNAARGPSAPPSPSLSNLALTPGTASREDLIRDMGTGLLITSLIGSTINATTGDYSRGASGFWVENGQIAYPVNECTIAGNLRDMLMRLTAANDARAHLSTLVPSLLVEGLTIAGA